MPVWTSGADRRDHRCTGGGLLMLDYDGTLAPFRRDPARAKPWPGVRRMLERISTHPNTRVVVVTGRSVEDLLRVYAPPAPVEVWASHGWEHFANGHHTRLPLTAGCGSDLRRALDSVPDLLARGARLEVKPASLALHVRGLPAARAAAILAEGRRRWRVVCQAGRLELMEFAAGIEIIARGRGKGTVVEELLSRSLPGERVAYLGDDVADEEAFRRVRRRGEAIRIGVGRSPTAAERTLHPPVELLAYLATWLFPRGSR
jgi:trehalose 6-phosphate synthase/trehalose 6-phosphate phosphatase